MLARKPNAESAQLAPIDRRRAVREDTRQMGWMKTKAGVVEILIVDFSTGGLGVTVLAPTSLDVGQAIEVSIDTNAAQRSWVAGKIMWCNGPKAGVSFLGNGKSLVDQMKSVSRPTSTATSPARR
jgi:hypothetical protein